MTAGPKNGDSPDRVTRYGATYYSFTAGGDLFRTTNDADVTLYTYDPLGVLTKVFLPNEDVLEYIVDGLGRRVGRKVNSVLTHVWLYGDKLGPMAQLDGAGNLVMRFVYGTKANVPDYFIK